MYATESTGAFGRFLVRTARRELHQPDTAKRNKDAYGYFREDTGICASGCRSRTKWICQTGRMSWRADICAWIARSLRFPGYAVGVETVA